MLSFSLQSALDREVIGQNRGVHAVVRAVTIAMSGLSKPEGPVGIYLMVGPTGTGKTHLARSLARLLHGDTSRLAVADCVQVGGRHEWSMLARQVAPYFRHRVPGQDSSVLAMAPLSILLVERLERARPELVQAIIAALESGYMILPDGKCGSLRGCLVLLTSNLCAREIYDAGRQEIGFVRASDDLEESEKARIYHLCASASEKMWGGDLLGHLDDLIVFHRLREHHLPFILQRLILELNRRLARRGVSCHLEPPAAEFLLQRAGRFLRYGAWFLVKAFRRFIVFPVADLADSGQVRTGTHVQVGLGENDRLRFAVLSGANAGVSSSAPAAAIAIPVQFDAERSSTILDGEFPG